MRKHFSFFFVILLCSLCVLNLSGCGGGSSDLSESANPETISAEVSEIELNYADQFTIEKHSDDIADIRIKDGLKYLVLPEGVEAPPIIGNEETSEYTIINLPLDSMYLAASSVMDLILAVDSLDKVTATATKAANWGLPTIKEMVFLSKTRMLSRLSTYNWRASTSMRPSPTS